MLAMTVTEPALTMVNDATTHEHALRRRGRPEEIPVMATYLVSQDASFVAGRTIAVDGCSSVGRDRGD